MTSFWWLSTCFVLLTVLSDCSKLWTWKATEVFPDFNRDRHWFLSLQKMDLEIPSKGGHVQSFTYAHCRQLPCRILVFDHPPVHPVPVVLDDGKKPTLRYSKADTWKERLWSLSRRIANPITNSVESQICWIQKWHVVGSWHWNMNETGALVPLSLKQYLGGRWSTHLHFAASFFSDWKDFTKKNHCNFWTKSRRLSIGLTICWTLLGICDSLLFDFLSDKCCWGPEKPPCSHVSWRFPPALHLVDVDPYV